MSELRSKVNACPLPLCGNCCQPCGHTHAVARRSLTVWHCTRECMNAYLDRLDGSCRDCNAEPATRAGGLCSWCWSQRMQDYDDEQDSMRYV